MWRSSCCLRSFGTVSSPCRTGKCPAPPDKAHGHEASHKPTHPFASCPLDHSRLYQPSRVNPHRYAHTQHAFAREGDAGVLALGGHEHAVVRVGEPVRAAHWRVLGDAHNVAPVTTGRATTSSAPATRGRGRRCGNTTFRRRVGRGRGLVLGHKARDKPRGEQGVVGAACLLVHRALAVVRPKPRDAVRGADGHPGRAFPRAALRL